MSIVWPRTLTPSSLCTILRHQKNPLTALKLFDEAQSIFPYYRHNCDSYGAMIQILGVSGRISEMGEVIEKMRNDSCESKDWVFVSAIKIYTTAKLPNKAFTLYKNIPKFNCVNWTNSFNTILQMLVDEQRFYEACRHFLEISTRWEIKSRLQSMNIFMAALCQKGRSDVALRIFREMKCQLLSPNRESYRILMKGLCQDALLNEANWLLHSMFWHISLKGCGEDVVIYRTLLDSLCDHGRVNDAVVILGKILKKGLKAPKRCWIRLHTDQLNGDEDKESIKRRLNKTLIESGVPSFASYRAMAVDFYNDDKIYEGDKVIELMQGKGLTPTVWIFESKIRALCRKGEINEVINLVEIEMVKAHCIPNFKIYNMMFKFLCEAGQLRYAAGFFEKMAKRRVSVFSEEVYNILVNRMLHEGEFVEASRMLEKMLVRHFWGSDEIYNGLVKGLCSIGKPYEAVMWLEEMISQARLPDHSVWSALVSSVCCDNLADFYKTFH